MAYGMKILDSMEQVTYDTSSQGGVFVEFLTLPQRTTNEVFNVPYPQLAGNNIYAIPIINGDHSFKLYGPLDTVPGYTSAVGYPVLQYRQTQLNVSGFQYISQTILMIITL